MYHPTLSEAVPVEQILGTERVQILHPCSLGSLSIGNQFITVWEQHGTGQVTSSRTLLMFLNEQYFPSRGTSLVGKLQSNRVKYLRTGTSQLFSFQRTISSQLFHSSHIFQWMVLVKKLNTCRYEVLLKVTFVNTPGRFSVCCMAMGLDKM